MDEYKGMKEKIESLENTIVSKDKQIDELKEKNFNLENELEDLASLPLFERVFNWKSNVKGIIDDE